MNKTFLEYVAEDIISKYGTDLSRIAVVFPNKRAALFLNEHLARLAGQPVWSPAYITISDLFRQHTDLKTADPIKLICDIHKSFTKCTGIDETLDHFYGWGQLLLADFDDIDKNMADADSIFCNLKDIHELDDISYLDNEQKEMLARFFANFSDDIDSELKKRFLSLWSHFGDIYHDYNRRLTEQGIGYEGAIYRKVASEQTLHLKYDKYLFVGFNLLQKVERVLFSRLMKEGKAKFYWDFDEYYMPSPSHHLTTSPCKSHHLNMEISPSQHHTTSTLKVILYFGELLVRLFYLLAQTSLVLCHFLGDAVVAERNHLASEYGSVHGSVHAYCRNGNAWGHLYDGEHSIESVEHTLDRHADDGQGGACSDNAWQSCCHACCGDDYLNATRLSAFSEFFYCVRCAMSREGVHLKRYLHVVQELACLFHNGQVGCAAHDDAN